MRTSGVLEGDEWVINGQKVWTSDAHNSNHMFALVRTDLDDQRRCTGEDGGPVQRLLWRHGRGHGAAVDLHQVRVAVVAPRALLRRVHAGAAADEAHNVPMRTGLGTHHARHPIQQATLIAGRGSRGRTGAAHDAQ